VSESEKPLGLLVRPVLALAFGFVAAWLSAAFVLVLTGVAYGLFGDAGAAFFEPYFPRGPFTVFAVVFLAVLAFGIFDWVRSDDRRL
jgi:hypothetical protein